MNPITYIKENGIKHTFNVIYQYKIDLVIQKLMMPFLKRKELKDIIVIESHNDFDCNGGAFYNYLIENEYNKKYKIVWLLKHKKPENLPENVEAVPLFRPSFKKDYYLAMAKYITADCCIMPKLRKEQKLFYFTHGSVAMKNCKGKIVMPDNLDYYLAPSENYAPITAEQLGWSYPNEKLVFLGCPVQDTFYHPNKESELSKITSKKYKKVVLWMPTFRKGGGFNRNDSGMEFQMGIPLIDTPKMYEQLNKILAENDSLLVIKIHPMQDMSIVKIKDMSNIKVLTGQNVKQYGTDNYRLMKEADALISDYSSVVFDYLHLNRPVAYVLCDEKEYKPGFVVEDPHQLMCGQEIFTFDEFISFISDIANDVDEYEDRRKELLKWLYKYNDGNSCKRVAEFMGL